LNSPALTDKQADALDIVEFLARKHALKINLQKGDMSFTNNLTMVHSREGYIDGPDTRRYLVRMWLRNDEEQYPIPAALAETWSNIFGDRPDIQDYFDIDPIYEPSPHSIDVLKGGSTNCG
jgi:hypothetical protein